MNSIITLTSIFLFAIVSVFGQEVATVPTEPKLSKEEKKAEIKRHRKDYIDWERKYFNSPGKWYVIAKAGYFFPFLTIRNEVPPPFDFIGTSDYDENAAGNISDKATYGTEGGGAKIAIAVGKMFLPFFGAELEMGYMDHGTAEKGSVTSPTYRSTFEADFWEMFVAPKIVFRSPSINNFYVYGKVGPHIGFWSRPTVKSRVVDEDGSFLHQFLGLIDPNAAQLIQLGLEQFGLTNIVQGIGYKTVFDADAKLYLQEDPRRYSMKDIVQGLGIHASIGFRYQISPVVSVFGEAEISGFNVNIAQSIIHTYTADITLLNGAINIAHFDETGGQILGNKIGPEGFKGLLDVIYRNELDENSNNPVLNPDRYNSDHQREEIAPRLAATRVGFNVGVQVNIPDKDVYYRENSKKNKSRVK